MEALLHLQPISSISLVCLIAEAVARAIFVVVDRYQMGTPFYVVAKYPKRNCENSAMVWTIKTFHLQFWQR